MSDVIELSKELRKELDNNPTIIEYHRYKDLVENDKELIILRNEIKKSVNDLEKRKKLLEQYNSSPIVSNYNILKEEVRLILKEISDIINKKWWISLLFVI